MRGNKQSHYNKKRKGKKRNTKRKKRRKINKKTKRRRRQRGGGWFTDKITGLFKDSGKEIKKASEEANKAVNMLDSKLKNFMDKLKNQGQNLKQEARNKYSNLLKNINTTLFRYNNEINNSVVEASVKQQLNEGDICPCCNTKFKSENVVVNEASPENLDMTPPPYMDESTDEPVVVATPANPDNENVVMADIENPTEEPIEEPIGEPTREPIEEPVDETNDNTGVLDLEDLTKETYD